jgi:hypothetical protein
VELERVENWSQIRARYEAFWQGEILDRPLVKVTAPLPDVQGEGEQENLPSGEADAVDWATNPERVMPRIERAVARTYHTGDAFPLVFPVSPGLVAIETTYLGCPYHVDAANGTAWIAPIIEDWDDPPGFEVDPDNFWWQASQELLEVGARRGAGRYVVGIPDLQGGGHVAVMMRGTERFAVDLLDRPQEIKAAIEAVNQAWLYYWETCVDITIPCNDGYVDWNGVWSDAPSVTVECDFAVMISPKMFNEFFLPALVKQTEWVERTVFHLDGEGQLVHLDTLLSLPTLEGIQWVPGAGGGHMSDWIPLLKRIQDAGKLLTLGCRPWEVTRLLTELKPEGVALSTSCDSAEEADALLGEVNRMFGVSE